MKTVTFKQARKQKTTARGIVNFEDKNHKPTRTVMLQETTPLATIFKAEDEFANVEDENIGNF